MKSKSFRSKRIRGGIVAAPGFYIAEELSLGYVTTLHTGDGPTVDTSDMLLSRVINSAASKRCSAPIEGRLVRGDTTKMCRAVSLVWLIRSLKTSPPQTKTDFYLSQTSLAHPQAANVRNH